MIVLDANLLIYPYDADSGYHEGAATWLEKLLVSGEKIGLPWVTIRAFVRVSTNTRIFANPRPVRDVFSIVRTWLALPGVIQVKPGPRHVQIPEQLIAVFSATGPLVTDAVLAALAIKRTGRGARHQTGQEQASQLRAAAKRARVPQKRTGRGGRHQTGQEQAIPPGAAAKRARVPQTYGATLASADRDFRRFPNLRWINPLAPSVRVH